MAAFAMLSACTTAGAPPAEPLPPRVSASLTPASAGSTVPGTIVDPAVLPGTPVAVTRGGEPRPVIYYEQPARLSPPGEPAVLPPPIPHGDRQATLVEAVPTSLVVGTGAADARRLVGFLNGAGHGRFDALHLEVRGRPSRVRAVIRIAVRAGVDPLKIRAVAEGGPGGGVEVIATRFTATAPVCPSQAIVGPSVNDNDFEPTVGCSNRANLAAMVNDPADLLGNPAVVPADGARAALGVELSRNGQGLSGLTGQSTYGTSTGQGSGYNLGLGFGGFGIGGGPLGSSVVGSGGPVSR